MSARVHALHFPGDERSACPLFAVVGWSTSVCPLFVSSLRRGRRDWWPSAAPLPRPRFPAFPARLDKLTRALASRVRIFLGCPLNTSISIAYLQHASRVLGCPHFRPRCVSRGATRSAAAARRQCSATRRTRQSCLLSHDKSRRRRHGGSAAPQDAHGSLVFCHTTSQDGGGTAAVQRHKTHAFKTPTVGVGWEGAAGGLSHAALALISASCRWRHDKPGRGV